MKAAKKSVSIWRMAEEEAKKTAARRRKLS